VRGWGPKSGGDDDPAQLDRHVVEGRLGVSFGNSSLLLGVGVARHDGLL
jgi:hypothetical protein